MFEDFQRLSFTEPNMEATKSSDGPTGAFYDHSKGQRVNTDATMAAAVRRAHPSLRVTIVPRSTSDLFVYASASGEAQFEPIINPADPLSEPLVWRNFLAPARRVDGSEGNVAPIIKFGKFSYTFGKLDVIVYTADGRDGGSSFPAINNQYVVHAGDESTAAQVDELIRAAGAWLNTLHEEIWIFDQGYWQKSAELWQSIAKSRWDDVILSSEEKTDLRADVQRFFDNRERYERYRIVWKRGVIYYGPPGNGKTISIKALANEVSKRDVPIAPLYVKSLSGFSGPEYSIKLIFGKARAEAPCLLVFEDLDSLVTDQVRSYFLNEVDGLSANSGVYMIGSTNHMDRLDPGISKRPSRFDRKFEFAKPNEEERITYCEYWRYKLKASNNDNNSNKDTDTTTTTTNNNNDADANEEDEDEDLVLVTTAQSESDDEIDFPKELSPEIAKITDGFSFAYLQEAFVATLLYIAGEKGHGHNKPTARTSGTKDKFEDLLFWRVIKKQIELLKEQI